MKRNMCDNTPPRDLLMEEYVGLIKTDPLIREVIMAEGNGDNTDSRLLIKMVLVLSKAKKEIWTELSESFMTRANVIEVKDIPDGYEIVKKPVQTAKENK